MAFDLYKNEHKTCVQKLNELRAKYGYFEMMNAYRRMDDESLMRKMVRLRNWNGGNNDCEYAQMMGEFRIMRVRGAMTQARVIGNRSYSFGQTNK